MGGTIIDIYEVPKVNPVVKVINDIKQDNLGKRIGPVFENFLRKQVETDRKVEEESRRSEEEEEVKKLPSVDLGLVASQCAAINILTNKEEKKPTNFDRARAAKAYGI